MIKKLGPYKLNHIYKGDCLKLIPQLSDSSIDIVVTSPPYWGQRKSHGIGIEEDPRDYIKFLTNVFVSIQSKLKDDGIIWINIGDAYNTPINWKENDKKYSSLGADRLGLAPSNSAYTKPRIKRKAFVNKETPWLRYGNLLALPYRLIINLCEQGYIYRGEIIWKKKNPMPEGRCRRPHRHHELIFLLAKSQNHKFSVNPSIKSVWEFSSEKINGIPHYSRFPEELPRRCIKAYGEINCNTVVLDPFSGSGTTSIVAKSLGCSHIGFEIDPVQVIASNKRIKDIDTEKTFQTNISGNDAILQL